MSVAPLFGRIGVAARLVPVLACTLALAGCEIRLGNPPSLFDDERAVARALTAVESQYSGPVRVLQIGMVDDGMLIRAQDPKNSNQIGEWRLTREQMLLLNWDRLSGPHSLAQSPTRRTFEDKLFDLKEVNLADWPKVADAAIARAGLRDKSGVSVIEIARQNAFLPGSASRALRWSIVVKSEHEKARVVADAKGEIVSVKLDAAQQMRDIDMRQRPDLIVEAVAEMREHLAAGPALYEVSIYQQSISFETTQKADDFPAPGVRANAVFRWSYNGLERGTATVDTRSISPNRDLPFGIDEVNWALLPTIVADAKSRLAMPNGRVTLIKAEKPSDSIGTPEPRWRINIEDGGESGTYIADIKGAAKRASLPKNKRKPIAWLDTGVMAQRLAQIANEFGPGGQIVKVFFEKDGGRVIADDPRNPGQLMEALVRDDGLDRWGQPMFEGGKPFPARDLDAFTADRMAALLDRTRKELGMPDAAIRDVTISLNGLGMKDGGKVAVAMVVRTPRGRLGRVVQALDGTLGEVYEWPIAGARP
jgi:hypothetical protein